MEGSTPHKKTGSALEGTRSVDEDLGYDKFDDSFATRLQEIHDELDAVDRGDYIWVPDEDCLLPPKEALDYFRREAENIARLLSFRESHPCRKMIPSPSLTPYGEDGEITLEWYARSGSVAIALESDEGLVWKRYHFDFSCSHTQFRIRAHRRSEPLGRT